MRKYLEMLITEKGRDLQDEIGIDGHIGLCWQMLVDYIVEAAGEWHQEIRTTLAKIDFLNGDVFHFLTHLANGMLAAIGADNWI